MQSIPLVPKGWYWILLNHFLADWIMRRSCVRKSEDFFNGLRTKGVTAIITGERGESSLTRQGLEEYVSDCVILLDFRVIDQIATRRLRIVKYRGSTHGTNEYPFLIDETRYFCSADHFAEAGT